jgi:beta-lactam-binding protein with PASTA domain
MKWLGTLVSLLLVVAAAACGSAEPKLVPGVTGLDLRTAEARLDARGIDHAVSGGGTFGVLLRSRWQVCEQIPAGGAMASEVALVVERSCSRVPATRAGVVPDVEHQALDDAEEELMRAGLGFVVVPDDTVIVRTNWMVCDQHPAPGQWGRIVELYVERDCWDW